jgi:peptide-methionine (R)-S-oxide reductase
VLREQGTERPFSHEYATTKDHGVFRCAGCGAELFSSDAKFDSGTGWPSFTEPAVAAAVELRPDHSHGVVRTEVICRRCGGHLGHVFDDGPEPTGLRYCINGVCLVLDKEKGEHPDPGCRHVGDVMSSPVITAAAGTVASPGGAP